MKTIYLLLILVASPILGLANNLNIQITSTTTNSVSFNISWMSSWRTSSAPNNNDAVWIFVKGQNCSSDLKKWEHIDLSSNVGNHTSTDQILEIKTVSDKKGVFIQRSSDGFGNIGYGSTPSTITLRFDNPSLTMDNIQVFGLEMVYIPQGSFTMGNTTSDAYQGFPFNPTQISSEAPLAANDLRHPVDYTYSTLNSATTHLAIPAGFPKGYDAIYCMKYEITQAQYVSFLNTLSLIQQRARTVNSPTLANTYAFSTISPFTIPTDRNGIAVITASNGISPAVYGVDLVPGNPNNFSNDGLHIAANYLSWEDVKAYLDWSALRPMSEMEFEKICRGPLTNVDQEYIHGSITLPVRVTAISNSGATNEIANQSSNTPNFSYYILYTQVLSGPMRVGFPALPSTSTRIDAGASYYGVLELGGNVTEKAVRVPSFYEPSSQFFDRTLGDGNVSMYGEANVLSWRGSNSIIGDKGGSYLLDSDKLKISYRTINRNNYLPTTANNKRSTDSGGRGVR